MAVPTTATDRLIAAVVGELESARPMLDAVALDGVNIFVKNRGKKPWRVIIRPEVQRELP